IRDILDWDYYLERFGSVIQKLITIPAAMQGVSNPVPRIRHPDWLARRVSEAANRHRQRQITDVFKVVPKDQVRHSDVDMEDFGARPSASASASAISQPRAAVVRRSNKKMQGEPDTPAAIVARIAELGPAPDPSVAYAPWLVHSKKIWALRRHLRALRQRAAETGEVLDDVDNGGMLAASDPSGGRFFTRTQVSLSGSLWQILQWTETDVPGELKAWVLLGSGQLHAIRVKVPRTLYVSSSVPSREIAGSRFFSEARSMVLPRASYIPQAMYLYKCVMDEAEYIGFRSSWSSFFAHPSIGGVYETEVTSLDRALIQIGASAWLGAAARRQGTGRSLTEVISLADLDTRRSTHGLPPHVSKAQPWRSRDLAYALFYHVSAADGRQFFALVQPHAGTGNVWVVGGGAGATQLQLPNLERLYRESRAAVGSGGEGAFAYPENIEFAAQAFTTAQAAYRAVNAKLAECSDERRAPVVMAYQSPRPMRRLQADLRALAGFPTVALPLHQADRALPAFDWQRHACRRMVTSLLQSAQWLEERVSLAQYADVPLGNIPADAPLFLSDVFFARKLSLSNHVLWWSPSSKPDLGGRQDDEFSGLLADASD
ncbi:DNA polymerase epsilon catalytic subunit, partial [Coemansia sp. RSA 2599]